MHRALHKNVSELSFEQKSRNLWFATSLLLIKLQASKTLDREITSFEKNMIEKLPLIQSSI